MQLDNSNFWQGEWIRLRRIEPEDAPIFFAWNQDSETARSIDRLWFPTSLAEVQAWAEKAAKAEIENDQVALVIEDRQGTVVGIINSHTCDRRTGAFRYGVGIRPDYRGRGYAAEAVRLLLRYFFQEMRYQKCTVGVYSNNPASIRLHEKLGFQLEGRIRRVVYTQGGFHDELLYGLTVEEFAARYP